MSVRAKFKVTEKEVQANGNGGGRVKLEAVTSGSAENDEFFNYTPYGELSMGTINAAALAQFELDDEFYIDFTKAD